MDGTGAWVHDGNVALLTDFYQLTMLQAYWREGLEQEAVFSLYVRRLPRQRNYLLACGLDDALRYLENLRFTGEALDYLSTFDEFSGDFVEWLENFRFMGDVHALPEGTPFFAGEPILEVTAPLPEAQIIETFVMNQVHMQTVLASKAARVVQAARGRAVIDFGLRRMHGGDAGVKAARAFHIAGITATSNVLAGRLYGIPVTGTMAHSYVQVHDEEMDAFRSFVDLYPDTILLVDTYDTLEGVGKIVALAREAGEGFAVRGVRLDSGDLAALAFEARQILDAAGLEGVEIFASGGLDEHEIERIIEKGAPITGFGVGTGMGVSQDAPTIDLAYKLTSYAGRGRLKLSPVKPILPGRKQVFRQEVDGRAAGDVIARADEELPGRPLLVPVMRAGERLPDGGTDLEEARARARAELDRLPDRIRALAPADPPYPVQISHALDDYRNRIAMEVGDAGQEEP